MSRWGQINWLVLFLFLSSFIVPVGFVFGTFLFWWPGNILSFPDVVFFYMGFFPPFLFFKSQFSFAIVFTDFACSYYTILFQFGLGYLRYPFLIALYQLMMLRLSFGSELLYLISISFHTRTEAGASASSHSFFTSSLGTKVSILCPLTVYRVGLFVSVFHFSLAFSSFPAREQPLHLRPRAPTTGWPVDIRSTIHAVFDSGRSCTPELPGIPRGAAKGKRSPRHDPDQAS